MNNFLYTLKYKDTMKHFFLGLSAMIVMSTSVHAQSKPKPITPKATIVKASVDSVKKPLALPYLKTGLDSFSYSLGMNIANNLKQQGIENVNYTSMMKAMEDIFKKKPVALTDQQANGCIQTRLQANAAKKNGAEKAKGITFLAKNKKRAEVITTASGLQYEVLKKGDPTSPMPKAEDTVVAHYAGTLIDGKKFDNSYDRGQPLTIPVGGVIKGWTEALQLMHIGDKLKVYIPSELGYGDRGAGADIPGGSTLIFEMELLEIKKAVAVAPVEEAKPAAPAEEKKPQ
jgi:FKBP-type peptidyl-prolyl cis-trans isomerase FklB